MNKLVTLCSAVFLLLVLAAVSHAYNFHDVEFNELLSSEFQDMVESVDFAPLHPRTRRDEEAAMSDEKCQKRRASRKPNKICCAEDSLDAIHEKEKDTSRSCFKEVTGLDRPERPEHGHHGPPHKKFDLFSCEEVEKRKSDMICIQECVGKKKSMLNQDGSPNPQGITKILLETFTKETWVEPMAEEIVSKCIAEARNATQKPIKYYTEVKRCSPAALTLKHCLFREVQLSCPADQIKDKGACERYQERLRKGEFDAPPPPPPPSGRVDVEVKEE